MTPAATLPDSTPPRRLWAGAPLAVALVATVAVAVGGGCGKPPSVPEEKTTEPPTVPKGDAWAAAAARLKRETDLMTCKSMLTGLRADTGAAGQKLPAMSEEALTALAALVPLTPADREEIRGGSFSEHDAAYLADCFYLRDAARSLALTGLPPGRQAELAFAWVCRQVYLHPWPHLTPRGPAPTALPPTAVLRRGYGSGLERMYVFLALLQQLELDACLIGAPDAGDAQSRGGIPISYPFLARIQFQRGPFWAVGVRVGTEVRLFDPWRAQPFPVSLGQLRANPDAAKAWFEDAANLSTATVEDARKATAFLAVPVNSLSARMATFEARLKGELGANVSIDPRALRDSFPDPKPAFWNPAADPFAYGRVSRSYLPVQLGGADVGPLGGQLYDDSKRDQMPASALQADPELGRLIAPLNDLAKLRLTEGGRQGLAAAFVEPPNPRERIQRGQYQEVSRYLVEKQETYALGLERLRVNKDAERQITEWVKAIKGKYEEASEYFQKDPAAEAAALKDVERLWSAPAAQFAIDRLSAEVGLAEASYLLALCKHEQAERIQVRLERAAGAEAERLKADVTDAWKTALSSWKAYEQGAAAHAGFPGRAAHAKELAARAAERVAAGAKK